MGGRSAITLACRKQQPSTDPVRHRPLYAGYALRGPLQKKTTYRQRRARDNDDDATAPVPTPAPMRKEQSPPEKNRVSMRLCGFALVVDRDAARPAQRLLTR
jgi:hypothetical protein